MTAMGSWSFGASRGAVFLALCVSLTGCPDAAPLENAERFEALDASDAAPTGCEQALPDEDTVGCKYLAMLEGPSGHCARSGCHSANAQSAGLNLSTADSLLIARILDVPARHETSCGVDMPCDPKAPACDKCRMCPADDFLLSRSNVDESWILKKMDAFDVSNPGSVVDMQCGTAMPYPPANTGFSAERRNCLKAFFTWIAENGRPCAIEPADTDGGEGG